MSEQAQALLRDALALPAQDRAELVTDLLATLDEAPADDPAAIQQAWAAELERRARRALDGTSLAVAWDHVHNGVRRRLTAG